MMHFNYYEYTAHESVSCSGCNGTGDSMSGPDAGRCGVCKGKGFWNPGEEFWREFDTYRYLTSDMEFGWYEWDDEDGRDIREIMDDEQEAERK